MKRYGNLYQKMFTEDSLFEAYKRARKGKRKKKAVLDFERNLGANIKTLSESLRDGTYEIRPYKEFTIFEPKMRTIYAPAFQDVVVQHEIYSEIYPIFNASFIDQSFACRVGYGTHKAARHAYKCMIATQGLYYLKMDIRKFFYRIDREVLSGMFTKKIKDEKLVELMNLFAVYPGDVGIPIGNLLSQLYALIYLNPLDHFIKRTLKAEYYVRYADDFVIFGYSRDFCVEMFETIQEFLRDELKLELSKWSIEKVDNGVNFSGYRMWPGKKLIRRRSISNFNKAFLRNKYESLVSIMGHSQHTLSLLYFLRRLRYEKPKLLNKMPQRYLKFALGV